MHDLHPSVKLCGEGVAEEVSPVPEAGAAVPQCCRGHYKVKESCLVAAL